MTYITLAIAVSFDSFTVGLIYGMRGIHLALAPLLLIMCQSAIVVFSAMTAGVFLQKVLVTSYSDRLGSLVLILLGSWMLGSLIRQRSRKKQASDSPRIRAGGVGVGAGAELGAGAGSRAHKNSADKSGLRRAKADRGTSPSVILSRPEKADADTSGNISIGEAFFLGFALALDAFGAGIAAAFLHYSIVWMPIVVACFTGAFLFSGLLIGRVFARFTLMHRLVYAPPILLIGIGLVHFVTN